MLKTVCSEIPFGPQLACRIGVEYDVKTNSLGAVFVDFGKAGTLGLKPGEFEPVAWKAEAIK